MYLIIRTQCIAKMYICYSVFQVVLATSSWTSQPGAPSQVLLYSWSPPFFLLQGLFSVLTFQTILFDSIFLFFFPLLNIYRLSNNLFFLAFIFCNCTQRQRHEEP